jgi:hypothetical protein
VAIPAERATACCVRPALLADGADALAELDHVATLVGLTGLGVGRRRSFVDHGPHDATFRQLLIK